MTPEEQAARDAVDAAQSAVDAALATPHGSPGWTVRVEAYRAAEAAWLSLATEIAADRHIWAAVYAAAAGARDRAEYFGRLLDEAAGR